MKLFRNAGIHSILGLQEPVFAQTCLGWRWKWKISIAMSVCHGVLLKDDVAWYQDTLGGYFWHLHFPQPCNSKALGSPGGDKLFEGFAAWLQRRGHVLHTLSVASFSWDDPKDIAEALEGSACWCQGCPVWSRFQQGWPPKWETHHI